MNIAPRRCGCMVRNLKSYYYKKSTDMERWFVSKRHYLIIVGENDILLKERWIFCFDHTILSQLIHRRQWHFVQSWNCDSKVSRWYPKDMKTRRDMVAKSCSCIVLIYRVGHMLKSLQNFFVPIHTYTTQLWCHQSCHLYSFIAFFPLGYGFLVIFAQLTLFFLASLPYILSRPQEDPKKKKKSLDKNNGRMKSRKIISAMRVPENWAGAASMIPRSYLN